MADVWCNVDRDGPPPCDGEVVYVGINSIGFACCFNDMDQFDQCWMVTPEDATKQMSDLHWWRVLDRPEDGGRGANSAPPRRATTK